MTSAETFTIVADQLMIVMGSAPYHASQDGNIVWKHMAEWLAEQPREEWPALLKTIHECLSPREVRPMGN